MESSLSCLCFWDTIYNEAASGRNKTEQIKEISINFNICSSLIDTTIMIYLFVSTRPL